MPFRVIAPDEEIDERLIELQTYQVHGKCPEEGCDGELRGTGHGISAGRTSWQNRCTKCDVELMLPHSYPYISHRPARSPEAPGD